MDREGPSVIDSLSFFQSRRFSYHTLSPLCSSCLRRLLYEREERVCYILYALREKTRRIIFWEEHKYGVIFDRLKSPKNLIYVIKNIVT